MVEKLNETVRIHLAQGKPFQSAVIAALGLYEDWEVLSNSEKSGVQLIRFQEQYLIVRHSDRWDGNVFELWDTVYGEMIRSGEDL